MSMLTPRQVAIKSTIARIFFNGMDAARVEDEAFARGNPNTGALNDFGIRVLHRAVADICKFKDSPSDDFMPAFEYFGPRAIMNFGMQLSGDRSLADFHSMQVAFARISDPSQTKEAAAERIKNAHPMELTNPHAFIFNPMMERIKAVFEDEDPDPAKIVDTHDGCMLDIALGNYCDYAPDRLCRKIFTTALTKLKKPGLTPEQYAHAAMLFYVACRMLPENGYDNFTVNADMPSKMIFSSVDKHYAEQGDEASTEFLFKTLDELNEIPHEGLGRNPTQFAGAIYEKALMTKIYQALEHDEDFVLSGDLEKLRARSLRL